MAPEYVSCLISLAVYWSVARSTVAYFTEESIDRLRSIDDFPRLASLSVPHGKYKSARSAKGRPDHIFNPEPDSPEFPRLEYIPYAPNRAGSNTPLLGQPSPHYTVTRITAPQLNRYPSSTRSSSSSVSSDDGPGSLAPLAYLQNMPPPRRHPIDEKTLKLFSSSRML